MSSGTPLWAVLAVAALGVLGTLAAAVITQILSGRREVRQWERQREHERERWDRERDERRDQWEREDHARWHQERLAIYTELLQRIEDWDKAVNQVLPLLDERPVAVSEEDQNRLGEAISAVAIAKGKLHLFASSTAAGVRYVDDRRWVSLAWAGRRVCGHADVRRLIMHCL